MQTINPRYQFYLRGRKIALVVVLILEMGYSSIAQNNRNSNLISYDERWIHYGFTTGFHSSKYVIRYSDYFTTPAMDSVHSIIPLTSAGIRLGFIINMKVSNYIDFRISPTYGFYDYSLDYRFTDNTTIKKVLEPVYIELPLLLKFKSVRRGNLAAYLLAGINPSLEAKSKDTRAVETEGLKINNFNLSFIVGVGLDMYMQYFKFSPEIRYAYGLRNMIAEENNFSVGLDKITTQTFSIFLSFEGGPSVRKKPARKTKGQGQLKQQGKRKRKRKRK